MRIAVACTGLDVASQMNHCSSFACYTVDAGVITGCRNVPNMTVTPLECATVLEELGIDVLIARHLSVGLSTELNARNIDIASPASNKPLNAAEEYLHSTLIGGDSLSAAEQSDMAEDESIESAFAALEKQFLAHSA